MTETFTAARRGDKRAKPEKKMYRYLTVEECKSLHGHADYIDRHGNIARVAITSVKTWKTRPDVEVRCKFGLYEYFTVYLTPGRPNTELVVEVENESD